MKKGTKNLLLGVGLAGGGFIAGTALAQDDKNSATVNGIFPAGESPLVPKQWAGKPTPLWFDVATWGTLGIGVGYLFFKK